MAVQTRAQLKSNILTNFADNITGNISAEDLRNQSDDEADSFLLPEDSVERLSDIDNAGSGSIITDTERTKLNGIAAGAEVNVQADWDEANSGSDAFIQNKPDIPDATSDLTNDSLVASVVAGTNVTVDNTDPRNPIVNASGGGLDSGTSFPGSPTAEQLFYRTDQNIIYFWDDGRSKWLSEDTINFDFGLAGLFDSRYLNIIGNAGTGQFGYNIERNMTIVGVTGRGGTNPTKLFEIDRNATLGVGTFSFSANVVNNDNLNLDFSANDYIRVWISGTGASVLDPNIRIIARWRG